MAYLLIHMHGNLIFFQVVYLCFSLHQTNTKQNTPLNYLLVLSHFYNCIFQSLHTSRKTTQADCLIAVKKHLVLLYQAITVNHQCPCSKWLVSLLPNVWHLLTYHTTAAKPISFPVGSLPWALFTFPALSI